MKQYVRFLAIALMSITATAHTADTATITLWGAIGEHDRVVQHFEKHAWTRSSHPQALIAYCGSLYAIDSKRSTCVLSSASSPQAIQFAGGLWSTWSGQTRKAKRAFEELTKDAEWFDWGSIGLLEVASYTENTELLKQVLDRLDRRDWSKAFTAVLDGYRLAHAEATADWDRILNISRKYPFSEVTRNVNLFSPYARALFVTGQREELDRLLKAASSNLQRTTEYMFRSAEYALLEIGIPASADAIKKYATSNPNNDSLALQRAYVEIFDPSEKIATAALVRIHEIAKFLRHYVRLVLEISATLASYDKPHEAAAVFNLIDRALVNVEDFSMFHTFAAWNEVYDGDIDKADEILNRAFRMAPQQVSANYLRALIAKRNKDAKIGTVALASLFKGDPYNENYASLILHFRDRFDVPDLDRLFQQVVAHQKYYGDSLRDRIRESEKRTKGRSKI